MKARILKQITAVVIANIMGIILPIAPVFAANFKNPATVSANNKSEKLPNIFFYKDPLTATIDELTAKYGAELTSTNKLSIRLPHADFAGIIKKTANPPTLDNYNNCILALEKDLSNFSANLVNYAFTAYDAAYGEIPATGNTANMAEQILGRSLKRTAQLKALYSILNKDVNISHKHKKFIEETFSKIEETLKNFYGDSSGIRSREVYARHGIKWDITDNSKPMLSGSVAVKDILYSSNNDNPKLSTGVYNEKPEILLGIMAQLSTLNDKDGSKKAVGQLIRAVGEKNLVLALDAGGNIAFVGKGKVYQFGDNPVEDGQRWLIESGNTRAYTSGGLVNVRYMGEIVEVELPRGPAWYGKVTPREGGPSLVGRVIGGAYSFIKSTYFGITGKRDLAEKYNALGNAAWGSTYRAGLMERMGYDFGMTSSREKDFDDAVMFGAMMLLSYRFAPETQAMRSIGIRGYLGYRAGQFMNWMKDIRTAMPDMMKNPGLYVRAYWRNLVSSLPGNGNIFPGLKLGPMQMGTATGGNGNAAAPDLTINHPSITQNVPDKTVPNGNPANTISPFAKKNLQVVFRVPNDDMNTYSIVGDGRYVNLYANGKLLINIPVSCVEAFINGDPANMTGLKQETIKIFQSALQSIYTR